MARPPPTPFLHGPRAAAAAEGAPRALGFAFGAGGRGYAPPYFLPPVVGRPPFFAADADGGPRYYGEPSRDYGHRFAAASLTGQPSSATSRDHYFPADGGSRDFGHRFGAGSGEHYYDSDGGPRYYGEPSRDYGHRFAAASLTGQPSSATSRDHYFPADGGSRDFGHRFGAGSGEHYYDSDGFAQGYGPTLPFASPWGRQPLIAAPGLAAGQGLPPFPMSNDGVAMNSDGRVSNAAGCGAAFGGPFPQYDIVANRSAMSPFPYSIAPHGIPVLCDVPVHTITRDNSHRMFYRIKQKLAQRTGRLYIALDLEYAASKDTNLDSRPYCSSEWYTLLREFVNGGDIVQLGMVLAFDSESSIPPEAYQINFHFDSTTGRYNPLSIDFLKDHRHNLDAYKDEGVLGEWVYADFIRHIPFCDDSVTWITFHADRDAAFLTNLLADGGRGKLPKDRLLFMHQVRHTFPVLYDCRVLAQLVIPEFTGSLNKLAERLGIKRTGEEHFAGSDALLTMRCFIKMLQECAPEGISARVGLLSGAEEHEMAIKISLPVDNSAINLVDVTRQNYSVEAERIYDILHNNFNIIAVQVVLPADSTEMHSLGETVGAQDGYKRMMANLNRADNFEVYLCFMNAESKIAYSRVWRFAIDGADQSLDLARLMASSGATHDASRVWVTMHGAEGLACLIKSFMAPTKLPDDYSEYMSIRWSCFPSLVDLGLVASSCEDVPVLPTTGCKGGLLHMASSLDVTSHSSDVVTMLRCYTCLKDGGWLQNFVPGGVLDRCCSTCRP